LPADALAALKAAQIHAYRSPKDPRPLIATATILTDQLERGGGMRDSAGPRRRPRPSHATTAELWRLMRGQALLSNEDAYKGDRRLAASLLGLWP